MVRGTRDLNSININPLQGFKNAFHVKEDTVSDNDKDLHISCLMLILGNRRVSRTLLKDEFNDALRLKDKEAISYQDFTDLLTHVTSIGLVQKEWGMIANTNSKHSTRGEFYEVKDQSFFKQVEPLCPTSI